jgi:3-oxoacyl-[acyl-carrier protein] reductase
MAASSTAATTLRTMMETNYDGTVWTIRAALPAMLATGDGGDIVIVSSVAGLRGGATRLSTPAPSTRRWAGRLLDRELREKGIRVTAVCPAGVRRSSRSATGAPRGRRCSPISCVRTTWPRRRRVLRQPRSVRTSPWALWSMGQQS